MIAMKKLSSMLRVSGWLYPLTGLLLVGFGLLLAGGCSLDNREGPDVTCADLECGRINACSEGILAQCVDGKNVRFHVCTSETVCEAGWQVPGQYRCSAEITDCEGCRPERTGCDAFGEGGAGGDGQGGQAASTTSSATGSGGAGGGAGGGGGA